MEGNLGTKLRTAREASGITVDDAVYRAKLPRAVVTALEAEDFGFFASPLYARSFLKQYGDYVGVDVTPWIDDLEPTPMIDGEAVESFLDLSDSMPPPATGEKAKNSAGGGAMAAIWLILITAGLVWGGMELFKGLEEKLSAKPAPAQDADAAGNRNAAGKGKNTSGEEAKTTTGPEPPRRAIIVREE